FFSSSHMPSKHVLCLSLLARVCLKTGQLQDAFRYCGEALQIAAPLDAPLLSYQAQFLMGQVYEAMGEPEKAYGSYRDSRAALNTLRSSLQVEELKIAFMKDKVELYSRLVQLCLTRDAGQTSSEEAFSYIEEAKSRTLRDLIFGRLHLAFISESEENETSPRIRDLRKELNWYYRRIEREQLSEDGVSREHLESLRLRARGHEHELLRLMREFPSLNLAAQTLQSSETASLEEIRASLGSEATLVE